MYTTGFQNQAHEVGFRANEGQDILKTKRRDIFLSPDRSFSSYFKETAALGRS
jgi:hypothetical protein